MMQIRLGTAAAVCFALLVNGFFTPPTRAAELDESEFRRLQALLQPAEDEPWRTIPWKIDLLEAQRMAASRRQPIFIWAMDGHPLGCT